jgi:hypothetical protein
MVDNEIEETAKAVQETAKATGKVVDAGRELGGFAARIFGSTLEEAGEMIHDQIRFWRATRALRLARRYEEIRAEYQISGPIKPVDLNFGVPLLEAASLQENDQLQDIFARLLVNATNPESKVKARRAFVSILQDFGPLEALVLDRIYRAPQDGKAEGGAVMTAKLPESYSSRGDENTLPNSEVQIALWNLARLGCVEPGGTWGGGSSVSVVTLTGLGRALVEATLSPTEQANKSEPISNPDMHWGLKNYNAAPGAL